MSSKVQVILDSKRHQQEQRVILSSTACWGASAVGVLFGLSTEMEG